MPQVFKEDAKTILADLFTILAILASMNDSDIFYVTLGFHLQHVSELPPSRFLPGSLIAKAGSWYLMDFMLHNFTFQTT